MLIHHTVLLTIPLAWLAGCQQAAPSAPVSRNTALPAPVAHDTPTRPRVELTMEGLELHRSAIVIDGHNDLPWKIREDGGSSFSNLDIAQPQPEMHTDIPRLKKGGVGAQFWSAWVPVETMHTGGATRIALEQIDLVRRMADYYPGTFEMAYTADDIVRIRRQGKIACLIGVEGGHTIENSIGVLRMFYDLGVRYLTLTHSDTLDWADSATDEARHGGLTPFGEKVVLEMNRLGMLIDISHVSPDCMRDVLRISRAPVIASHSSAYAVAAHPRNVPDDVLKMMPQNDGVIMVNFYSTFVEPRAAEIGFNASNVYRDLKHKHPNEEEFEKAWQAWKAAHPRPAGDIHNVIDHIDHMVKVAGVDHVGIGSDFDGVPQLPRQLEDVSCFPYITQELLNRGYSKEDIKKILGENVLRVMRKVERTAAQSTHG